VTSIPSLDQLADDIAPGSPVERLSGASQLAASLRARGDELLDQFVDAARAGGSSWSEIGRSLGTSRQAAQQRFAALADPPAAQPVFGLNGPAGEMLSAAAEHARGLGHHHLRPEHLILALAEQPEELAGQLLAELGVIPAAVRTALERRLGAGPARPGGSLGVAPQTKRLLELARSVASALGHRCPRTEHVLLAAASPKLGSPAASLLAECGVEAARLREELARTLLREAPELAHRLRYHRVTAGARRAARARAGVRPR
jgi:Clp amino terminal domain, pathogenicity island component